MRPPDRCRRTPCTTPSGRIDDRHPRATWHRIPRSWRILATIALTVPLATGLVGLGRYSNECFPLAIAGGITLTRAPRWARTTTLITSTTTALALAIAIASHGLVP